MIGQTPNIAKRLQEAAPPGCVYISATTCRLVERHYDAEALGQLLLKGLPQPVEAFRVVGPKARANSVDQFEGRALAPLVSRSDELASLEQRWALACRGQGQTVLIEGEPGIGKSRLLHSFLSRPGRAHCRVLTTQCQQQFANSALYPLIDLLRRDLGLQIDRAAQEQAALLRAAFAAGRLPLPEDQPLVAQLLELPGDAPPAATSPRALRERRLEWLARWLLGADTAAPAVLVVEDLHWADASTLDCLGSIIERAGGGRVLVLLTHRPEFTPPWAQTQHAQRLLLRRIAPADARGLAQNIAGAIPIPEELLQRVAARSDGVPLFVEELTKMLIEASAAAPGQPLGSQWHGAVAIPETLRGSLAARLDHLKRAKTVAQFAAVLGREFSYGLLRSVAELDDDGLQAALAELMAAELLFRRGQPPAETFVFKHVLVQEAAYLSLLKARRADYHLRTAHVLVAQFSETVERHPELAAHHFAAAGRADAASDFWHRAGRRALDASADVEAVGHLRQALAQLEALPNRHEHSGREVDCLVTLGSALTAMRGYAAAEVESVFARARALCESLGDTDKLYSALTGLHSFYQVRGALPQAVEAGRQLVDIAESRADTLWRAQSHRCLGWSLFCIGQVSAGAEHLYRALGLFDRLRAHEHARIHGAHPWIVGFVNCAFLECFAGRIEHAVEHSRDALALAREIGTPLALAYALCMSAAVYCERQEPEPTRALAEEAIEVALRHDLPYWSSWGNTLRGWALVHQGQHAAGLAVLNAGLDSYRATGSQLFEASSLALLAQSHATTGDPQRGLAVIEVALANPLLPAGYFYAPELHRLHGALLLASGDSAGALRATRHAQALARAQGAAGLEQRAADQLRAMAIAAAD